jgi:hypothetical protein
MHPSLLSSDVAPGSIRALRGKLSYEALRSAGVPLRDVPLGDPGVFVREARVGTDCPRATPRYRIGLCAHYVDRSHDWVLAALRDPEVADLDVHLPPGDFIARMLQSDIVVSSSLHGLIFAESLGIPSAWIEISDRVVGDGFKFRDWFSLAESPQKAPFSVASSLEEVARGAALHDVRIDTEALKSAFPHEIAAPSNIRLTKSVSMCRQQPPPVFILSFARGRYLQSCVTGCLQRSPGSDVIVHDFGSDDDETTDSLIDLERAGITVVRDRKIDDPDELNRIDLSVAEYFDSWAEPGRYVVTDCDVDISVTSDDAMDVYDCLLDRFPKVGCVGPMLKISDIPPSYPLYNRVMNKQIEKFWSMSPEWTVIRGRKIAYQVSRIDTTFALHRAGSKLKRPKPGIRVYHPYEALHLDWYILGSEQDSYASQSSKHISHWNNRQAFLQHREEALRFRSFTVVERDQRTGELVERKCAPASRSDVPGQHA